MPAILCDWGADDTAIYISIVHPLCHVVQASLFQNHGMDVGIDELDVGRGHSGLAAYRFC